MSSMVTTSYTTFEISSSIAAHDTTVIATHESTIKTSRDHSKEPLRDSSERARKYNSSENIQSIDDFLYVSRRPSILDTE